MNNGSLNVSGTNGIILDDSNLSNKRKRFIILGVLLILIIGLSFIAIDYFSSKKDKEPLKENEVVQSISYLLSDEYEKGIISADSYVTYLLNYFYDYDFLPEKYKNLAIDYETKPEDVFILADSLKDKLSNDTLTYLYKKAVLSDVKWDVEVDPSINELGMNLSNKKDFKAVELANDANVSKLDHVMLSTNKNFLIYYTTSGKNAVNEDFVNKISSYLESVVDSYKKDFGMDFKYEDKDNAISDFGSSTKYKVLTLLKKNNIDFEYLDKAMPVYIIDTDVKNTGNYAFYMSSSNLVVQLLVLANGTLTDAQNGTFVTAYSFPYITISSSVDKFDDLKIISAHELFHHYQKYICGDGKYGDCVSGLFTTETTANLAASMVSGVNKVTTVLNLHAKKYAESADKSIDLIGQLKVSEKGSGYAAFVFAHNYATTVNGGLNSLLNSMKEKEPLKYLRDSSFGKYKDVLINMAIKNLTLDYDNKLFVSYDGKNIYPKNRRNITNSISKQEDVINYSSMHYYYINPKNLNSNIEFSTKGNLSLLLFKKENNNYRHLKTLNFNDNVIIDMDEYKNEKEIVIAIVNSDISGSIKYYYNKTESKDNKVEVEEPNGKNENGNCTIDKIRMDGPNVIGQYGYWPIDSSGLPANTENSITGWRVVLDDPESTEPVTSKVCKYLNAKPIISMIGLFSYSKTSYIDLSSFDTSLVTDMSSMFSNVTLDKVDLSTLNLSNVNNIELMFSDAKIKSVNLNNLDVSKVSKATMLFSNSQIDNLEMNNWSILNLTERTWGLFPQAKIGNLKMDNWSLSSNTNTDSLFYGLTLDSLDLNSWNINDVSNLQDMFKKSNIGILKIDKWNVSHVNDMSRMFEYARINNLDLSAWKVTNGDIEGMFNGAEIDNLNLGTWSVEDSNNVLGLFSNAKINTLDIHSWNFQTNEYGTSYLVNSMFVRDPDFKTVYVKNQQVIDAIKKSYGDTMKCNFVIK